MKRAISLVTACVMALSVVGAGVAISVEHREAMPSADALEASETTIIVVRHANKEPGSPDPNLSEKGRQRAKRLAAVVRYSGVDAVYASDTARAQQTAAVVVQELKLDPKSLRPPYDPRAKIASLASTLLTDGPGHVILVVAHSNTIPPLLKELGGWEVAAIKTDEDFDHDHVFVVTLCGGGAKRLICAGYPPAPKNDP